ncbi:hypothetical protein BS17DRAFT_789699, partial [Gyrodon lividus]
MMDDGTKQQAVNGRKAPQIDPHFSNSTILLFLSRTPIQALKGLCLSVTSRNFP